MQNLSNIIALPTGADVHLDGTISELAVRRSEFPTLLRDQGIPGPIAALKEEIQPVLRVGGHRLLSPNAPAAANEPGAAVRLENRGGHSERFPAAAASNSYPWAHTMQRQEKMGADGLITLRSSNGPEETMNRFEAAVRAQGLTVFAQVDHAAGAAAVGLSLRPTEVLLFGNARGGTPLMEVVQTIGIDLPLKALVWQDAAGDTWLSYNDPAWFARRHGVGQELDVAVAAMTGLLQALATAATAAP